MAEPPVSPDGVRIAFYGGEGARVELIQVSNPAARATRLGEAEARIEHIALEVDDVREVVARLRARGVRFVTDEPYPLRDMLAIWTVAETSAGIQWQLYTRVPGTSGDAQARRAPRRAAGARDTAHTRWGGRRARDRAPGRARARRRRPRAAPAGVDRRDSLAR